MSFVKKLTSVFSVLCLFSGAALVAGEEDTAKTEEHEAVVKAYPSDLCIVSDEKLGSMGDAYVFTESGYEVKMCCKGCVKDFNSNKEDYLAKLKKMHEAASEGEHEEHEKTEEKKGDHSHHDH